MQDDEQEDELSYSEEYGMPVAAQGEAMAQPVSEQNAATEIPVQESVEAPQVQAKGASGDDFGPLVEAMKAAGFNNMDEVHSAMAQQQAEAQVGQELAAYQTHLQSRIDSGALDPEDAQEMYDLKSSALETQAQVQAQQAQLQMQQQAQAAKALATLSPELAQAAQQLGLTPEQIQALAPLLEQVTGKVSQKAVSEYVAQKGQGGMVAPIPQGASSAPAGDDVDEDAFSFGDLVAAGKFK